MKGENNVLWKAEQHDVTEARVPLRVEIYLQKE